jgi:hypothetical protein
MMPGKWHNIMEKRFPIEMREVKFFCSSIDNNTCRRADILLSIKRTCEIQHSYISEKDIIDRFNDWNKFGKEIIWLIDGNEGIVLNKLSTGNYLIIFKDIWKYKSFIKTYDFILLEIGEKVFKIELNKIKSGMLELKEHRSLTDTIEYLKTKPENIWEYWTDENIVKSILGVYQQGAGNGKTYGIWKSIVENIDKKTYIILTKQHSAKVVIYEELKDQKKRFKNGEDVFHIENIEDDIEENTEKHYVIKYTHKISKRECIVIIGTIDSFCFNLCTSNVEGADYFKGIIDNIKNNGATKVKDGFMKYGGQYIQLSKECEIWIDEVQDLPINYLHAMCKLIHDTGCYINVVGDKLQSLEYTENFLTSIIDDGLPNITIDIRKPINVNRRIKVANMSEKINEIINFVKYKLPIIECGETFDKANNTEPIKIIKDLETVYADDKNFYKITSYCNKIMKLYKNEVEVNNYFPNDFLIIFPIMKSNVIATELESKIQEYWINKYNDNYKQYVYLHKHTQGTVINTTESINATRIMSIRSSKGDGRKVVFILKVTEASLKLISSNDTGLVFESYLHVALTRAKVQIYFELSKNKDDIYKRFCKVGYVDYLPNISKIISLDKLNELIDKERIIELFVKNNVGFDNVIKTKLKKKRTETIEWGYHCIKYQTFLYNVILDIVKNKNENFTKCDSQLFVKLSIISRKKITDYNVYDFWNHLEKYEYDDLPDIPLCILSTKPEYIKYYDIVKKATIKVQYNIINNTLTHLTVYESIILTYLIEIFTRKRYSCISPMDILNITDFFHKNSNKEQEFLNNISNIKNIINKSSIKKYTNINWNIFKHIRLHSKKEYFKINKSQFPIIGYNKTDIVHIILKTNISQLNFWDIMIEILLERFLIFNPCSEDDNIRYIDKHINTYCFILDDNCYLKIKWGWDKSLNNDLKREIYKALEKYYMDNHIYIYYFFNYIKDNSNNVWQKKPEKVMDIILEKIEEYKNIPEYIIDFLKTIRDNILEDDEYDYEILNSFEMFDKKINKKLQSYLKQYLDI